MDNKIDARLNYPPGATPPDSFYVGSEVVPSPSFVVSRDRNGHDRSLFSDMVWDFSAYHPDRRLENLYFTFWGEGVLTSQQLELVEQAKVIIFCLIWRRSGRPLSTGTLRNYLSVLCALCTYACQKNIHLRDVLGDALALKDFCVTSCSGWMQEILGSLLPSLAPISMIGLGYAIVGDEFIKNLKKESREYRSRLQQHPPMPTRIYSNFIMGLVDELEEWRGVERDILDVVAYCSSDPRAGRVIDQQIALSKKLGLSNSLFSTVEEYIAPKAQTYLLSKGHNVSVKGLSAAVGHIQYVCKLIIQTFTGMRDDEVNQLPYHCVDSKDDRGSWHYFIGGRTTKFVGGRVKRASWVTNLEGYEAALAAQRIADIIYKRHNIVPASSLEEFYSHPLFVSVAYLGLGQLRQPEDGRFAPGLMTHRELPSACVSTISEQDLQELEQIDPYRAWRTEERFLLGNTWLFTSHQTRRSLALYAQRSGLVSLPSLRRQLKHITDEMSRYYARGSYFADNFIGDSKGHFGLDWQAAQPESSALSYIVNVILTDERLFGGHGAWVQKQDKAGRLINFDRAETLRRFQKGEMAYRETVIGGCVSTERCDQVAVNWLHGACIANGCKNLVGSLGKLDRVIAAQQNLINLVDVSAAEYPMEALALDELLAVRKKITEGRFK